MQPPIILLEMVILVVVSDMVCMKQWTYCWLILFCGHSDTDLLLLCCVMFVRSAWSSGHTADLSYSVCHSDGCCFVVSDMVSMKQWTYCWPILFCGHSDGCCFVVSDTVSMKQWTYCWPNLFCGHWWMVTLMVVALLCQTWSAWSSGHTADLSYSVVTLMVVALLCQTRSAWSSGLTADLTYSVVTDEWSLWWLLLCCVRHGQHEAVDILLKRGARLQPGLGGRTPLVLCLEVRIVITVTGNVRFSLQSTFSNSSQSFFFFINQSFFQFNLYIYMQKGKLCRICTLGYV